MGNSNSSQLPFPSRSTEHLIPEILNKKWRETHKFSYGGRAVNKFLKLYREKMWNCQRKLRKYVDLVIATNLLTPHSPSRFLFQSQPKRSCTFAEAIPQHRCRLFAQKVSKSGHGQNLPRKQSSRTFRTKMSVLLEAVHCLNLEIHF